MNTNHEIHLIEIPVGGNGGLVWNRLHSEREDICEALLKDARTVSGADGPRDASTTNWHRELLQARLRKIDDALDRLMSGSYGNCSKCGRSIEDTTLEFDTAIALCGSCWEREQKETQPVCLSQNVSDESDSNPGGEAGPIEVVLETLQPFDTILLRTRNSDYRILLLDPTTGRATVEGGHYLIEPREAFVIGSCRESEFKLGSICVGYHLEMSVDERNMATSRVQSISVAHRDPAESIEAITSAVH